MIGICHWCELSIEDGEPWVRLSEGAQGYTSTVMLHAEGCLDGWRDRTPTQELDTKVAVTREVEVAEEDEPAKCTECGRPYEERMAPGRDEPDWNDPRIT